jgi:hypothetical protein
MATKQLLTCIGLLDLEQVFIEADEDLMPDLSVVRISIIRDVHYDSIDLKVLVYGQERMVKKMRRWVSFGLIQM